MRTRGVHGGDESGARDAQPHRLEVVAHGGADATKDAAVHCPRGPEHHDLRRRTRGRRLEIDRLERRPRRRRGVGRDAPARARGHRAAELQAERHRPPVREAPDDDDRRPRRRPRQRLPRPSRAGRRAGALPPRPHRDVLQHRGRRGARDRRGRRAARAAGGRVRVPRADRAHAAAGGVAPARRRPDRRDRPAPGVDRLGRAARPRGRKPRRAAPARPRPPPHRLRPHLHGRGRRRPRPPRRLRGRAARRRRRADGAAVVGARLGDDPRRPPADAAARRAQRARRAHGRLRLERPRRDRPDRGLRGGRDLGPARPVGRRLRQHRHGRRWAASR